MYRLCRNEVESWVCGTDGVVVQGSGRGGGDTVLHEENRPFDIGGET